VGVGDQEAARRLLVRLPLPLVRSVTLLVRLTPPLMRPPLPL
jgi:hypothetical protein